MFLKKKLIELKYKIPNNICRRNICKCSQMLAVCNPACVREMKLHQLLCLMISGGKVTNKLMPFTLANTEQIVWVYSANIQVGCDLSNIIRVGYDLSMH